jgi:NADH-quinone oxidoreductase subunit C
MSLSINAKGKRFMSSSALQVKLEIALSGLPGNRQWFTFRDSLRLNVDAASLTVSMMRLRELGFNMLIDVTAVDLLEYKDAVDRYRLVYQLLSTESGARLEVNTHVNDPSPQVPTMTMIWSSANWMEREAYDMFGIVFEGHPNAKRLLLPDEFVSFPLRKDYPVKGRGERHNFPVLTRSES